MARAFKPLPVVLELVYKNFNNYKKQRNYCVKLLKTEKKNYYNNLDTKVFTDNKQFWKSIKPLFSDKQK